MTYYRDAAHLYETVQALFERIRSNPEIAAQLRQGNLIARFRLQEPEAIVTFDLTREPIAAEYGESDLIPDVEMSLRADINHLFWLGKLNVPQAFATRKIVARGSIPKALKLLPALRPAFEIYPQVLRELGYEEMIPAAIAAKKKAAPKRGLRAWISTLFRTRPAPPAIDYETLNKHLIPLSEEEPPDPAQRGFADLTLPSEEGALKIEMWKRMRFIRTFETAVQQAYLRGDIPSESPFLSTGQEGTAVGACFALQPSDYLATTYRCFGHLLAKGADPQGIMAEVFGKATGLCKGKGGQMHLTDMRVGVLGANGIVGASLPICVGAALSAQLRNSGQVALCFLGDGATNHGMFHEALNFAAVFDLPAIFVIENNLYGEFTPLEKHTKMRQLSKRAEAYGMPGVTVDGNDVWAVYQAVAAAVARAQRGEGPTLIECLTYLWRRHTESAPTDDRPAEELAAWQAKCPITRLEKELLAAGLVDQNELQAMANQIQAEVDQIVAAAKRAPEPEAACLLEDVFAPEPAYLYRKPVSAPTIDREITFSMALNEALSEEMTRDERVFLIGEDIGPGGYFGVTEGLLARFGPKRVIDTPISEYALVGGAIAAAMTGLRPVVEIQFSDFLTCCMDPLVNQTAKLRYVSGGQYRIPMVVRSPGGAGISMGAQHSQSLEAFLTGIPGLIVIAPGTPCDAKGLLKSAIRGHNPVLFFENKLLYAMTGGVPKADYLVPIGVAEVKREGQDVTVVAIGSMVNQALAAAVSLTAEGISVEVVDPRTLVPLDLATIVQSVSKTGRLVVAEEGHLTHGFGGEIVARVMEVAFGWLRAPAVRVAAQDVPIPYNRALENIAIPDADSIAAAVRRVCSFS